MSESRGRLFDRRMEDALVARLDAGHAPEALLAELRTRLDDATADGVLSRAEARFQAQRNGTPPSLPVRILVGLAYLWTVLLIVQNLIIAITVVRESNATPPMDDSAKFVAAFVGFALLKVGLLCAGAFAYKRWRSAYVTAFYSATLLYAFPLGLFIDQWISPFAATGDSATPLSVSALCSYASVLLICLGYWLGRQATPRLARADPQTFD
jgi:hypothetical protein